MDPRFETDSNISSNTSLDGRAEKGHNGRPVSLQYPLHERFGVRKGDEAVVTKNKRWLVKTFTYICLYCYQLRWWLLQIGLATLCIRTTAGRTPPNFEMSKLISIARGTPYMNPSVVSVIFKKKQDWHDPTCSEGRLEDLMTNDFESGSLEARSPTFTAHFTSKPETRPGTLMTSNPRLIEPESWKSYTAHVEGNPHEDHSPMYDSISSPKLDDPLGIQLESDLGEPVMEDNCNCWTSCCTFPLSIWLDADTSSYFWTVFFENATMIYIDELSHDTSQDPHRSGSHFDKLVLACILTYIIFMVVLLIRRSVHGSTADRLVAFRSAIFYYIEPRLAFGKKRVRWICSKCGRPLYDDFQEIQPGAIARLQQDLYERYEDTDKRSNSGNPGSPSNLQNGGSRKSKISFGQWWSCWRSSGGRLPELPLHQGRNIPSQDPDIALPTRSSEIVFLLLCIPHRKWATKLVHMDLCTLLSDQLFFAELQTQYKSMQGKRRRWFTLKQLTRIQFVQFELHMNELVDIQMTNVLPPNNREDYRYSPAPPEIIPPVGENLLMHLYEHPEDADDDAFCLDRIPKKLRERLVRPQRGGGIGWGVHLKEGLNLKKTCIFGLLGLFISALFGVIWSVKRDDIQGGFSVAAFLLAALTFATGIVQTTLEPE